MPAVIPLWERGMYFHVNSPGFSQQRRYRALTLLVYSETGEDWLTFVTEDGALVTVSARCCLLAEQRDGDYSVEDSGGETVVSRLDTVRRKIGKQYPPVRW